MALLPFTPEDLTVANIIDADPVTVNSARMGAPGAQTEVLISAIEHLKGVGTHTHTVTNMLWAYCAWALGAPMSLSTFDPTGLNHHESYYDLLWVNSPTGKRSCIPAPMVSKRALMRAYREAYSQGRVFERTAPSDREPTEPDGKLFVLLRFLWRMIATDHARDGLIHSVALTLEEPQVEKIATWLERADTIYAPSRVFSPSDDWGEDDYLWEE